MDKNKILGDCLHECRTCLFPQGFSGDCKAWNKDKIISALHRGGSNPPIPPPLASIGSHYMGLVLSFKYDQ